MYYCRSFFLQSSPCNKGICDVSGFQQKTRSTAPIFPRTHALCSSPVCKTVISYSVNKNTHCTLSGQKIPTEGKYEVMATRLYSKPK